MPRNVRNFWVSGSVDGAVKEIGFGPRAANGAFGVTIYQRNNGNVETAVKVSGHPAGDFLILEIHNPNTGERIEVRTKR